MKLSKVANYWSPWEYDSYNNQIPLQNHCIRTLYTFITFLNQIHQTGWKIIPPSEPTSILTSNYNVAPVSKNFPSCFSVQSFQCANQHAKWRSPLAIRPFWNRRHNDTLVCNNFFSNWFTNLLKCTHQLVESIRHMTTRPFLTLTSQWDHSLLSILFFHSHINALTKVSSQPAIWTHDFNINVTMTQWSAIDSSPTFFTH